jgi:hypothetical protein
MHAVLAMPMATLRPVHGIAAALGYDCADLSATNESDRPLWLFTVLGLLWLATFCCRSP